MKTKRDRSTGQDTRLAWRAPLAALLVLAGAACSESTEEAATESVDAMGGQSVNAMEEQADAIDMEAADAASSAGDAAEDVAEAQARPDPGKSDPDS